MKSMNTAVLTPIPVGKIAGHFYVPAYQRGFRWGTSEVERLLDDIEASNGRPYYLQPIVVKAREDGSWELVDGQQRLTTLYLILRYIRSAIFTNAGEKNAEAKYSLEYETRPGSATYLETLDEERAKGNIDYFHMLGAYQTITSWFENPVRDKYQACMEFYSAFAARVMVIWYQAAPEVDATALFTRLNVGRIPLTDSELIKALLLAQLRSMKPDRSQEVAAQWDAIERNLRAPEAWAFISARSKQEASHIGLLLDALAGTRPGRMTPLYQTFETLRPRIEQHPTKFWNDVVDLHSRVMGWYDDRETYHRIGYLVSRGMTLQELLQMSSETTKSAFKDALTKSISDRLSLTASALRDLNYRSSKTEDVLFLMNVQTVLRNKDSSERYSFHAHAAGAWTLEHIHAQHAETLNTAEQWREWLRLQLLGLDSLPDLDPVLVDQIRDRVPPSDKELTRREFGEIEQLVLDAFETAGQEVEGDIDSIDNLALLPGGINSALKNSMFEVKRQEIIRHDRAGSFIPVCTRNVFLKYYTDALGQQNHFWGALDRADYLTAMVDVLQPYLKGEADDERGPQGIPNDLRRAL